ncbi:MAG: formylglycine-generating enzyme family protein [Rhodothermales bacterium]
MRYLLLLAVFLPGCALLRSGPARPDPPFVPVPGGAFAMGAPNEADDTYARPTHPVTVAPFALMAREVTFAEFDRFADATGIARPDSGDYGRGARAVVQMTWDEAAAFCAWIDARLPTEPEWEWAARGGPADQRWAGTDDTDTLPRYARFADDEALLTTAAALRQPNPLGLYDLSGNAFEWIGAFYQSYPEPGAEPVWYDLDAPAQDLWMVRGGSFRTPAEQVRTFARASTLRDIRSDSFGFRCAR